MSWGWTWISSCYCLGFDGCVCFACLPHGGRWAPVETYSGHNVRQMKKVLRGPSRSNNEPKRAKETTPKTILTLKISNMKDITYKPYWNISIVESQNILWDGGATDLHGFLFLIFKLYVSETFPTLLECKLWLFYIINVWMLAQYSNWHGL